MCFSPRPIKAEQYLCLSTSYPTRGPDGMAPGLISEQDTMINYLILSSPDLLKMGYFSLFSWICSSDFTRLYCVSQKQSLLSCLCCMADPLWGSRGSAPQIFFILESKHREQTQSGICQTHGREKRTSCKLMKSNVSSQSFSVELAYCCLCSDFIGQSLLDDQAWFSW